MRFSDCVPVSLFRVPVNTEFERQAALCNAVWGGRNDLSPPDVITPCGFYLRLTLFVHPFPLSTVNGAVAYIYCSRLFVDVPLSLFSHHFKCLCEAEHRT